MARISLIKPEKLQELKLKLDVVLSKGAWTPRDSILQVLNGARLTGKTRFAYARALGRRFESSRRRR